MNVRAQRKLRVTRPKILRPLCPEIVTRSRANSHILARC